MDGWIDHEGSEQLEGATFWESMVETNAVVYEGEQRVVRSAVRPYNHAPSKGNPYLLVPDEERTNLDASRFW